MKKIILTATTLLTVTAIAVTAVVLLNRNPLVSLASAIGRTVSENFTLDIGAEIGSGKDDLFKYNVDGEFYATDGTGKTGMLTYTPGGTKDDYTYSSDGYLLTMNADGSGSIEREDMDDAVPKKLSAAIAQGDYESVAEILNADVFKEQVLDPSAFAEKMSELVANITDVDYLENNFDFMVESDGELDVYSFKTPLETVESFSEKLFAELEPVLSNKAYLQFIRNTITEIGFRLPDGMLIGFELDFTVCDGYLNEVTFTIFITEEEDRSSGTNIRLSVRLDDIGETDVNGDVINEFNRRKTQLGNEDYISWDEKGNISYEKSE